MPKDSKVPKVDIIQADLADETHIQAILKLVNAYMEDEMGISASMEAKKRSLLIEGLVEHPASFQLLAWVDGQYVGLANCFIGFSTFQAKKLINVHDLMVINDFRGKGIGRKLLQAVALKGQEMNCCKITLEVRNDNLLAQNLYRSEGYQDAKPPMLFWSKDL